MKAYKLADIQSYLSLNYLTLKQLSEKSDTPVNMLLDLINAGCIPGPSYEAKTTVAFTTHIFGETRVDEDSSQKYFSPATVEWIKRAKEIATKHNWNFSEVADAVRQDFIKEFGAAIRDLGGIQFGFQDCFDANNELNKEKFDEVVNQKWSHVLKGTYGVCTRNPSSAREIARKLIVAAKLAAMTDDGKKQQLTPSERAEVLHAMKGFDEVVTDFAPHDRCDSSRKRLFDDLISRFGFKQFFRNS